MKLALNIPDLLKLKLEGSTVLDLMSQFSRLYDTPQPKFLSDERTHDQLARNYLINLFTSNVTKPSNNIPEKLGTIARATSPIYEAGPSEAGWVEEKFQSNSNLNEFKFGIQKDKDGKTDWWEWVAPKGPNESTDYYLWLDIELKYDSEDLSYRIIINGEARRSEKDGRRSVVAIKKEETINTEDEFYPLAMSLHKRLQSHALHRALSVQDN